MCSNLGVTPMIRCSIPSPSHVCARRPYGGSGTAEGAEAHRDSVYCLATNPSATLLASGSVDTDVRPWDDPRARSS